MLAQMTEIDVRGQKSQKYSGQTRFEVLTAVGFFLLYHFFKFLLGYHPDTELIGFNKF